MNTASSYPALREWRTHMRAPTRVASFLGAAAILTLIAPFNTGDVMRTLPLFAYWSVIVVLCYSAGYWANVVADHLIGPHGSVLRRIAIAAPLTSLGVLAVVCGLNGLAIGYWPRGQDILVLAGNVVVIATIVTTVFCIAGQDTDTQTAPTPLLERLPFDKRAPLVACSVEDHYVRIRTTKGEDMVLMRLADAIKETGGTRGLQVHRSHWVALDQITSATRKGDGALLSMTHGPDIPVSRANVPAIREAGFLPRN